MQPTYAIAMAAGKDAANRRMQAAGRKNWNRADYNHAAAIVTRLIGTAKQNPVPFETLAACGIVSQKAYRRVRA